MNRASSTPSPVRIIRFGVFEADLQTGELRKDGLRIKLQEQPFRVLTLLLERAGEVVTRDELRQKLWSTDTFVDFEHSLNTSVKKRWETQLRVPASLRRWRGEVIVSFRPLKKSVSAFQTQTLRRSRLLRFQSSKVLTRSAG